MQIVNSVNYIVYSILDLNFFLIFFLKNFLKFVVLMRVGYKKPHLPLHKLDWGLSPVCVSRIDCFRNYYSQYTN